MLLGRAKFVIVKNTRTEKGAKMLKENFKKYSFPRFPWSWMLLLFNLCF